MQAGARLYGSIWDWNMQFEGCNQDLIARKLAVCRVGSQKELTHLPLARFGIGWVTFTGPLTWWRVARPAPLLTLVIVVPTACDASDCRATAFPIG